VAPKLQNILANNVPVQVFDDIIAEKWKAEAMSTPGRDVSQKMADWVIEELRWKAKIFQETGTITVYNGDVVKSDTAVSNSTKLALQAEARKLEDIPEIHKDYHPGSDGQVLDLVHPSLFPLVYGKSRVLEDRLIGLEDAISNCGEGTVVPVRDEKETWSDRKELIYYAGMDNRTTTPYSKDFQWLPCEVDISTGDAKYVLMLVLAHLLTTVGSRATSTTFILINTKISTASLRPSLPKVSLFGTGRLVRSRAGVLAGV